jgi:hypothetical protein
MKNIFKTIGVFTLIMTIYGCSDSYFDVNTPGNTVNPNNIALKDILSPAIQYTISAQYTAATNLAQVDQHIANAVGDQNIDNHYQNTLDSFWSLVYVKALANIKVVENKATETNSSHYKGIAQVLKAINIGLATDLYGDIPYSEATLAGENLFPKYNTQQVIYADIDKLLSDAIANFSAPNTSAFTPGKEDLIYNGDMTKWLKAAYTFRARYQLHLSKVNGTAASTAVIASLSKGFTSNADDFQLNYNNVNLNPWYSNQLGLNTGNILFNISKHFISYMNGSVGGVFPFTTVSMDPRMPILVDIRNYPNPTTSTTNPDPTIVTNYKGAENGKGASGSNAHIGVDFFYSRAASPVVILTFAEAKFMEAEANFILAGGTATSVGTNTTTNSAYLTGIAANMDKLVVSPRAKAAYLADLSINKGTVAVTLKDIMRQKFIALFLNPETFTDYRRYNFSTNVFANLTIPANADPLNGGKWIRRFVYSNSERNTNTQNYKANFKSMVTPVWWDL